jgi:Prion-inhibition and propagation
MPRSYQHLNIRLQLEQTRLLNWGEKVGLVQDLLDQPSRILHLHRNLVLDILLEVQCSFKACLKKSNKYGPLLPPSSSAVKAEQDRRTILQKTVAILDTVPQLASRLQ